MTTLKSKIKKIIFSERLISKRIERIEKLGLTVNIAPMGSGGKGQIKEMSYCSRVQISYGWGKWNYAYVVDINN